MLRAAPQSLRRTYPAALALVVSALVSAPAHGQTFQVIHNFDLSDGAQPFYMSFVQGFDGDFYGTTPDGGANGTGVVFKMTRGGAVTVLHDPPCSQVNCLEGDGFVTGLTLAPSGSLYGIGNYGGANNQGVIYSVTETGEWKTRHNFEANGGYSVLTLGTDGALYGVATVGGAYGAGSVFKMNLSGSYSVLYSFCEQTNCPDGDGPYGGLTEGADGDFLGFTINGGANSLGTIFKITPQGSLTTLYSFCSAPNCADGYEPHSPMIQASDRNFYGTTVQGGTGGGTAFRITPEGQFTTIYTFCLLCEAGGAPVSGVIEGSDGRLYGTTVPPVNTKGPFYGAIYRMQLDGAIAFLHSFNNYAQGAVPYGGLTQGTDGLFYGTTTYGGGGGGAYGTAFSLTVGLDPFVRSLPGAGQAGQTVVKILGGSFTGASGVTFNDTAANFVVVSDSEVTATVPAAATTGRIAVTIPGRVVLSNANFHVRP